MPPPRKKKKEEEVIKKPSVDSNSGVIRFEVDKISTLEDDDERFSSEIEVRGVPWAVKVCKEDEEGTDLLCVYLCCLVDQSTVWSIDLDRQFVLIHSDSSKNMKTEKYSTTFSRDEIRNWGDDILKWKDLMDDEKEFVKEDKITVEAHFTITEMRGIRIVPRVDFTDPNEPRHDIALLIGGQKIYVNKGYLSLHSSVFNAMFYGDSVETNMEEIELTDVDGEEFLEMLRVIYPSYENITDDNVHSLLAIGDRFKIKLVLDLVEKHLISSTNFQTSSKLLLSDQYKLHELKEHCLAQVKIMEKEKEDKSRLSNDATSGFIRFEISDVSTVTTTNMIFSPVTEVLGLPWSLKVRKFENDLAVYLHHRASGSNIWSIDVSSDILLVNIGGKGRSLHRKIQKTFDGGTVSRGYSKFISWDELTNVEKGFISDDGKIVIEARFTLSNIIGIRTAPCVDFTDSNDARHDVALIIEGEKIHVNKGILAVHSPVFNAMFYGEFVEKNKKEIEIKDIKRKELVGMLNMIYPSYDKITDNNIESLLKMADRFQVKMITDQVEKFLIDSSKLSVPSKLKISDQYRLVMLQDHCLDTFKAVKDVMDLKTTDIYKELSNNAKATLLDKAMKLG